MREQSIVFILAVFLTLLSFAAVLLELSSSFVIPFIFLLAVVQATFQLYYFMHLKDRGHKMPQFFMLSAALLCIPIVSAIVILT